MLKGAQNLAETVKPVSSFEPILLSELCPAAYVPIDISGSF